MMGVINIEFLLIQLAQCLSPLNLSIYLSFIYHLCPVTRHDGGKKKKKTNSSISNTIIKSLQSMQLIKGARRTNFLGGCSSFI